MFPKERCLPFRPVAFAAIVLLSFSGLISPGLAAERGENPRCGYSPLHTLKYTKADLHFAYVNPGAPKGGKVRVARVGTFNSLNFIRYPGSTIADRKQIPLNVADYLFDSLLTQSADEPSSFYCLAAKRIEVARDLKTVRFQINDKARFHDGKPITAKDIIFTFETLKKQGPPFYRQVLAKISARPLAEDEVEFQNKGRPDREFVRKVGSLPIHPAHFKSPAETASKSMALPLGSGPYRLKAASAGKYALLERVKDYWAREHFTQKGRYNFNEIHIDYYRDKRAALEAYKVGKYDLRLEDNPLAWAREYSGEALAVKEINRIKLPASQTGDLFLLAFNQRRAIFKNRKVRRALALLYDFESANRILYHGLYSKAGPVYGSSRLSAKGPASANEKKMLARHLKTLPEGILETAGPDQDTAAISSRMKLRLASKLLDEAGLIVKDNKRIEPQTGQPLKLEISFQQPEHSRILLHYGEKLKSLGIELSAPNLDPSAASKKALSHEFDLIILKWTPEYQPGITEYLLWSGMATKQKMAYAFAGVEDPALDQAIYAMNGARNQAELETAAKTFDRIFRWQYHAIPLWRQNEMWVSHRKPLTKPETSPEVIFSIMDRWWYEAKKQAQRAN